MNNRLINNLYSALLKQVECQLFMGLKSKQTDAGKDNAAPKNAFWF